MSITRLFGPPGCGKTTRAISIVEQHLADGIKPYRIAYLSFTKKATIEAKTRAMQRFGFEDHQLPYFKTIHALVFKQLGMRRDQIMQWSHYRELGRMLGIEFSGRSSDGSDLYGMGLGDRIMFIEGLSRTKKEPLAKTWEEANEPDIDWFTLDLYARSLEAFKARRGLQDFNDILSQFVKVGERAAPKLDILIVDECQDTSPLQWDVLRVLIAGTPKVYAAGDDEQCIFSWSGADVNQFLDLEGELEVLDQSYRVPETIHKLALTVSSSIQRRQPKTWKAKAGEAGSIAWHASPEDVDLSEGTWLLLARNGYMLAELEAVCIREGFSFTSVGKSPLDSPALRAIVAWERLRGGKHIGSDDMELIGRYRTSRGASTAIWHEALDKIPAEERDYFIAARRRGETLTKKPRINISTIHAAKGGEADHVLLMMDVSAKSYEQALRNPDDERRVLYVAVTRAKQSLHLIQPRTNMCFEL